MKINATDMQIVAPAVRYEAFILLGDGLRRDSDGLGHGAFSVVDTLETIEEAHDAASVAMEATPTAIGCGVRRAQHKEQLEGTPPHRFLSHTVASDYMRPTFEPGDVVEIDTAVQALSRNQPDGVYLLAFPSGEPALRRLQVSLVTGRVCVSCDRDASTPNAQDECDESELRILGRATRVANIRNLWGGR